MTDKVAFQITNGKSEGKMFLDSFMTYVVKVINQEIRKIPKPVDSYSKEEAGVLINNAIAQVEENTNEDLTEYVKNEVLRTSLSTLEASLQQELQEKEFSLLRDLGQLSKDTDQKFKSVTLTLMKDIEGVQSALVKEIETIEKELPAIKKETLEQVSLFRDNVDSVITELNDKLDREVKKLTKEIKKLATLAGTSFSIAGIASIKYVDDQLALYAKLDGTNQPFTGSITAPSITASGLAVGRIVFTGASGLFSEASQLKWDNTNKRLSVTGSAVVAPLGAIDIVDGTLTMVLGADNNGNRTLTDSTNHIARIASRHYLNAEEPVGMLLSQSSATDNVLSYGGGSGIMNTATEHRFFTAPNTTTTLGTQTATLTGTALTIPSLLFPTSIVNAGFGNTNNITAGATNALDVGIGNTLTMASTASRGTVIGQGCTATLTAGQQRAIAIGQDCSATGVNSVAIGRGSSGAGVNIGAACLGAGTSIGNAVNSGTYQTAVAIGGSNIIASNDYAVAIGGNSVESRGFFSLAMGEFSTSTGVVSASIGVGVNATADGACSIGANCDATGMYSLAMGTYMQATALNSAAIGLATTYKTNAIANTLRIVFEDTNLTLDANRITTNKPFKSKGYLVSTLPAGQEGDRAHVTDALAPTYLGTLTGGGTVKCPVFHNGTAWVSH